MTETHSRLMYATKVKSVEFEPWPKLPRLLKDMTITEKIDGTNACVVIVPHDVGETITDDANRIALVHNADRIGPDDELRVWAVYAQSRKRMITPESDNYGFAAWVRRNANMLVEALGSGRHYGEWWGKGIQRGYGSDKRTFSLFNTGTWGPARELFESETGGELSVVPELYAGPFDTRVVESTRLILDEGGSKVAAPGWDGRPEGVCVFHHASRTVFKVTEADEPKGGPRDSHGNVVPLFRSVDPDSLCSALPQAA